MDGNIAGILILDGLTNGVIYALLAMAIVLVFAVTRVIFIPQGEYVAFAAITVGFFQLGQVPGTVWLLLFLSLGVVVYDLFLGLQASRSLGSILSETALRVAAPIGISLIAMWCAPMKPPLGVQMLLALLMVTSMGPLLYRLAYESLADSSVLVLLILSVGVHFALTGLGLLFFGAEGFRTPSLWDSNFDIAGLRITGQAILVFLATAGLIVALFVYFERTLSGKSLRATAVNRTGARLIGVSTHRAGSLSFAMSAFVGGLSGLLIGPTTTVFYDSGFLIGLKGFVGAVFGGLASFPGALLGALIMGVVESFGSFWASAFKEVIVFTAILPILLWRSLVDPHTEEH